MTEYGDVDGETHDARAVRLQGQPLLHRWQYDARLCEDGGARGGRGGNGADGLEEGTAIDAKFPAEDFDRLLLAAEAGDLLGVRDARRGLEARLRRGHPGRRRELVLGQDGPGRTLLCRQRDALPELRRL